MVQKPVVKSLRFFNNDVCWEGAIRGSTFEPLSSIEIESSEAMKQHQIILFCLSVLLLSFSGCFSSDGNIGWVEGIVTVDGEPIDNATVRFYPVDGRGSSGTTDANGHYELRYTRSQMGAIVGQHKVTVSTEIKGSAYGQESAIEDRRESLPKKYIDRKKTELAATVTSGNNKIDFALESK